jgi:hypothetical protein
MEESEMSNIASGINPIGPVYPVRPAQPSNKDRETGKRQNEQPKADPEKHDDDDHQNHIDEHV